MGISVALGYELLAGLVLNTSAGHWPSAESTSGMAFIVSVMAITVSSQDVGIAKNVELRRGFFSCGMSLPGALYCSIYLGSSPLLWLLLASVGVCIIAPVFLNKPR